MDDLIAEYKNSLPSNLCDEIINNFEKIDEKQTEDNYIEVFIIPKNDDLWNTIENTIYSELSRKLVIFLNKKNNFGIDFKYFSKEKLCVYDFEIRKYKSCDDRTVTSFKNNSETKTIKQVIKFIWYLNNIENDGETLIIDTHKIKPEKGKLVLFPYCWCFPTNETTSIYKDKYIITGYLNIL
jgi:hypothetical protein